MALVNNVGRLRGRCTFIEKVETENARGMISMVDKDIFTTWYSPVQHNQRDMREFIGTGHSIKKTIIIRYIQRHDINNTMRVRIKDKIYDIEQIIPDDEYKEYTTIVLKDAY